MCVGSTGGGCHSRETMGSPRQGGRALHAEFPCLIHSCGSGTESTKERNQITRAALAGCATVSGPEVNSLIFPPHHHHHPVPPTEGAGLASLAFCVSLSGGVKGREATSRGWSVTHAAPQTGRWTDAALLYESCPPTHAKTQHRFREMKQWMKNRWYPAHNVHS